MLSLAANNRYLIGLARHLHVIKKFVVIKSLIVVNSNGSDYSQVFGGGWLFFLGFNNGV